MSIFLLLILWLQIYTSSYKSSKLTPILQTLHVDLDSSTEITGVAGTLRKWIYDNIKADELPSGTWIHNYNFIPLFRRESMETTWIHDHEDSPQLWRSSIISI